MSKLFIEYDIDSLNWKVCEDRFYFVVAKFRTKEEAVIWANTYQTFFQIKENAWLSQ